MAAPQNFRSAFNGFNREDVVHYLEYINTKHKNQIDQLSAENQELRASAQRHPLVDQQEVMEYLQNHSTELNEQLEAEKARNAELTAQLEEEKNRCAELTAQLEALQSNPSGTVQQEAPPSAVEGTLSSLAAEELEAYRRAERIEREAKERAELVYYQANGVLTEASAKVDAISADITDMADQVMQQLTQLQIAVSSSKQALQDASSIMGTIRPNK